MKTVVALYDHISDANAAVRDLVDFGLPRDNISLMANDTSGNYSTYLSGTTGPAATAQPVESTASGAATGAGIGAIIGGLGGLLVGLGILVIPGVGPVLAAGPLATAISALTGAGVGAMAGGAAGGLIGALVDLGLPEESAGNYAEGIRRGGILVTVRTEDNQAEDVRRIMNRHNVVNLDDRVRGWREQGWTGYNANTPVGSYGTPSDVHSSDTSMGASGTSTSTLSDVDAKRAYDERFYNYDTDFQQNYRTNYANRGYNYEYYQPAYYYGYQLAADDRYRDYTWADLEPEARRQWEAGGHQGAWEDFKDSVAYAWERVKTGVRETFD